MDTLYSIPPLHIMGSLIYDYCRISASGSGGDQKATFSMLLLLLVPLLVLALYHEKVDDKLSLGNGNITDLTVCFFLFPFGHWHESLTGDFPIVQGFVDYPRMYMHNICMIVNKALCPGHHKLYCQEYQFRSDHLFRALILREQITCLTL